MAAGLLLGLQLAQGLQRIVDGVELSQTVKEGLRVVRGPDWDWDDQDHGEGQVGTVVERKLAEKQVIVLWDFGTQANYNVGNDEEYDLRVIDNRPLGIEHPGSKCSGCGEQNIKGMKWRCSVCRGVDLCTKCFMADKHIASHAFIRFNEPSSDGVKVPKRSELEKIPMNGIFPGAKVVKGKDWRWGRQNETKHMTVQCDSCQEDPLIGTRWKCMACPDYDLCTDCYNRMEHQQHPFLKIASPGATPVRAEQRDPGSLLAGNLVNLLLRTEGIDVDVNAGDATMSAKVIGEDDARPGWVEVKWPDGTKNCYRLGADGKVDLKYTSCTTGGFYYKETLPILGEQEDTVDEAEVPEDKVEVGDSVRIDLDLQTFMELQAGHGKWSKAMSKLIGKTGKVLFLTSTGDLQVKFESGAFTINPAACSKPEVPGKQVTSQTRCIEIVMIGVGSSIISDGDLVYVNMDRDALKSLQKKAVGWNEEMAGFIGRVGKVTMVTGPIVMVEYEGHNKQMPFNSAAVTKVSPVTEGDLVVISRNKEMVKKVQAESGGWASDMSQCLGRKGRVVAVVSEKRIVVVFSNGKKWVFNPRALTHSD